jgi:hypothetical protein
MARKSGMKLTMRGNLRMKDNGGGNITLDFTETARPVVEYGKTMLLAWDVIREKNNSELENVSFDEFLKTGAKMHKDIFLDYIKEIGRIEQGQNKPERVKSFAVPSTKSIIVPEMKINHKLMKSQAAAEWVQFVLPDLSIFGGQQEIKTKIIVNPAAAKDKKKKEVDPYAFYLLCVESAWCAIWDAVGTKAVSTIQAYNAFTGNFDGRARAGSDAIARFESACKTLADAPVLITSEFDIDKLPDDLRDDFRAFFRVRENTKRLPVREVEKVVLSHGVETISPGFALKQIPPLYLIAKASGQIITKDVDLFEIADENGTIQESNEARTLCKYYLLIRIYDILSNPRIIRVITFDDIFLMSGLGDAKRYKDRRIDLKKFSRLVVADWVRRGFRYKDGRRYFTVSEQKKGGGDKAGFIIHPGKIEK